MQPWDNSTRWIINPLNFGPCKKVVKISMGWIMKCWKRLLREIQRVELILWLSVTFFFFLWWTFAPQAQNFLQGICIKRSFFCNILGKRNIVLLQFLLACQKNRLDFKYSACARRILLLLLHGVPIIATIGFHLTSHFCGFWCISFCVYVPFAIFYSFSSILALQFTRLCTDLQ